MKGPVHIWGKQGVPRSLQILYLYLLTVQISWFPDSRPAAGHSCAPTKAPKPAVLLQDCHTSLISSASGRGNHTAFLTHSWHSSTEHHQSNLKPHNNRWPVWEAPKLPQLLNMALALPPQGTGSPTQRIQESRRTVTCKTLGQSRGHPGSN